MSEDDDDDGEDVIEDEEEENEKRDSGYGSQGQIKKPVSGLVYLNLQLRSNKCMQTYKDVRKAGQ